MGTDTAGLLCVCVFELRSHAQEGTGLGRWDSNNSPEQKKVLCICLADLHQIYFEHLAQPKFVHRYCLTI